MRYKKGIILAAGKGSRLSPATKVTAKPLLPVFDKPMLYYALCNLMLAGIRDILFISRREDIKIFKKMFGSGKQLGMKFSYTYQRKQIGIPDAMRIGKRFIGKDSFALALADNLFIGKEMEKYLSKVQNSRLPANILSVKTKFPEKSAVIEVDIKGRIQSIVEKPSKPKSNDTIPGLYFYDKRSVEISKKLKKSKRGELEIVDVHLDYHKNKELSVIPLSQNIKWFDTGDSHEMLIASNYVMEYQKKNKTLTGSIELVAYQRKWISKLKFRDLINKLPESNYKNTLKQFT